MQCLVFLWYTNNDNIGCVNMIETQSFNSNLENSIKRIVDGISKEDLQKYLFAKENEIFSSKFYEEMLNKLYEERGDVDLNTLYQEIIRNFEYKERTFTDALSQMIENSIYISKSFILDSVVSDDEYDALKRKLKDEYGVSFPDFTEYSNVQNDSFASVRIFLDSQNYEYIDKTAQGGCLYIFDEKAVDVIKAMGLAVSYAAEGTRSTKHRPAWYVKSDK